MAGVVAPSKAKTWVAAAGSVLTVVVPVLMDVAADLPQPWPAVAAAVVAVLTVLGVYEAPYRPKDTIIVPDPEPAGPTSPPGSDYPRPWPKP